MFEPFVKLGIVGVIAHAFERYLERIGRPGAVVYVKIGTYVTCGIIACVEWSHFFHYAANLFGFYPHW